MAADKSAGREFGHPIPILRIFDEAKAREFYVDFLGVTAEWEHRFEPGTPIHLQIAMSDVGVHLSEHFGDACGEPRHDDPRTVR